MVENFLVEKFLIEKKSIEKINKNKSVNFWCLYSIVNCSGTRGILTHRKNNCLCVCGGASLKYPCMGKSLTDEVHYDSVNMIQRWCQSYKKGDVTGVGRTRVV